MKTTFFTPILSSVILAACGGGGGGGSSTTAVVAPPVAAPTVSVSISQPKVSANTPVTVSWTSTNATSCTGLDAMIAGAKATSGSVTITPTAGSQYTYTISCDGAGGTAKQNTALVVPIPVQATSYLNFKNTGVVPWSHTDYQPPVSGWTAAVGQADFFQNGSMDIFTASLIYDRDKPLIARDQVPANLLSDFVIWRKSSDNSYTKLWSAKGCVHPRKAIIADYNKDGYPDTFVSCHGWDQFPHPGEKSMIVLSDGNGGFAVKEIGDVGYWHTAAAADVNSDDYPDIVLSSTSDGPAYTFFLINNKDGTFSKDTTRIVGSNQRNFALELVDVDGDGAIDLVGGYDEIGVYDAPNVTSILYGDGNGKFGGRRQVVPQVVNDGIILDFTVTNNNNKRGLYVGRTSDENSPPGAYMTRTLQYVDVASNTSNIMMNEKTLMDTNNWVKTVPVLWWLPVTVNGKAGISPYDDVTVFVATP